MKRTTAVVAALSACVAFVDAPIRHRISSAEMLREIGDLEQHAQMLTALLRNHGVWAGMPEARRTSTIALRDKMMRLGLCDAHPLLQQLAEEISHQIELHDKAWQQTLAAGTKALFAEKGRSMKTRKELRSHARSLFC